MPKFIVISNLSTDNVVKVYHRVIKTKLDKISKASYLGSSNHLIEIADDSKITIDYLNSIKAKTIIWQDLEEFKEFKQEQTISFQGGAFVINKQKSVVREIIKIKEDMKDKIKEKKIHNPKVKKIKIEREEKKIKTTENINTPKSSDTKTTEGKEDDANENNNMKNKNSKLINIIIGVNILALVMFLATGCYILIQIN